MIVCVGNKIAVSFKLKMLTRLGLCHAEARWWVGEDARVLRIAAAKLRELVQVKCSRHLTFPPLDQWNFTLRRIDGPAEEGLRCCRLVRICPEVHEHVHVFQPTAPDDHSPKVQNHPCSPNMENVLAMDRTPANYTRRQSEGVRGPMELLDTNRVHSAEFHCFLLSLDLFSCSPWSS